MTGHLEREFKLLLPDEAALESLATRLVAAGGARGATLSQSNTFFDTRANALRRARLTLRLRREAGRTTLTLKGPTTPGPDALAVRPEEELVLEPAIGAAVLAGSIQPLEVFRTSALRAEALVCQAGALVRGELLVAVGAFENERLRIGPLAFPPGSPGPPLVFELDRTRFPGGAVERELELELPDESRAAEIASALHGLFHELGLPLHTPLSKAARLFLILDSAKEEV